MRVAIALIFNSDKKILITQRSLDKTHGGRWEFPGGKLEKGETALAALQREVKEEIGIEVLGTAFFCDIEHSYSEHMVILHVYCVDEFNGVPVPQDSQMNLSWVDLSALGDYDFPEANLKIIERLCNANPFGALI